MRRARLGELAAIVSGATPKTGVAKYWDGDVPWATPADLSKLSGPYISATPRMITGVGVKSCATTILPPNSVLLSSRAPIGHVAINKVPMATNQGFKSLVPGSEIDAKYLYHWLKANTSYLQSLGNGATFKELSKRTTEQIELPVPSIEEQRRIAAILDHADALRAKRRQVLAFLETLIRAMYHERFVMRREPGWPTMCVGEVGRVQLGRQRSPKYQTGEWTRPYMRVANVQENRLDLRDVLKMDFDAKDFDDYRLEKGDILLNEGQSTELVGRPAKWDGQIENCCFQNTLLRFQADRNQIDPDYALAVFLDYLHSGAFAKTSSKTSNVAHLGKERFAAMPMLIPPLPIQREFTERLVRVNQQRVSAERATAFAATLLVSLQSRAFRGEL